MSDQSINFQKDANKIAFDKEHRRKINFNISKYDTAVLKGKKRFSDLETARRKAANIKHKSIIHLDKLLVEFETNFIRNGGKIVWARHAEEAAQSIVRLLENKHTLKVVKSKSMMTEEIELNEHLAKKKIEAVETDLGEYIVQLSGEKPYHIVTPAMHKSKEDVSALFHEKFDLAIDSTPEEITHFVRDKLRVTFQEAGAGITGANFLIADIGGIALTENEGNGLMSMAFPVCHIVVAGIEKMIPSIDDLDLFWPLLAIHGTGQAMTAYNSIVTGPVREGEGNGPSEMILVLIDNGRTSVMAKKRQRAALSCIRCGACLNACPVYKNIGGHSYQTTYSGPIGAVITPLMKGMSEWNHLSFASSLCGGCTEVCPVKIPLHELLLVNRNEAVKEGFVKASEKRMMFAARKVLGSRKMLDFAKGSTKNFVIRKMVSGSWGNRRLMPVFAKKSFSQLWQENQNNKKSG
ncbi:MAG: lactate utilization protein B [Bacteroidales bacterium]|nr:lactate utilization protein B [Bacteroidales bacterium]